MRQVLEDYITSVLKSVDEFKKQMMNSEMSGLLIKVNREKKIIESLIGPNLYY